MTKVMAKYFLSINELSMAYETGEVGIHAKIKIRIDGIMRDSTVGRILLYEVMPENIPFELVNKVMTKRATEELVDTCFRVAGGKSTVLLADRMRTLGFKYSTKAGISISIHDMEIPENKTKMLDNAQDEVMKVQKQYSQGLITDGERYNKVIDIWARTSDEVANEMMKNISFEEINDNEGNTYNGASSNPIYMMIDSGARGSQTQVRQLAGMRGLDGKTFRRNY